MILWRFNAIFTALRVQNVLHASSSIEKIPETRKSQSFADFEKKLRDIFIRFEIIPRLNAHFTSFYTQNLVDTSSSVETSADTRKSQSFADFDEN